MELRQSFTLEEIWGKIRYLNARLDETQCEVDAIARQHTTTKTYVDKRESEIKVGPITESEQKGIVSKIDEALHLTEIKINIVFDTLVEVNKWIVPQPQDSSNPKKL